MIHIADEVSPAHPALAGHFPGNPIVPGALLLARVAHAAAQAFGTAVAEVPTVKFLAPLRPGERFDVGLDASEAKVRFRVTRGATVIASGTLSLAR